MAMMRGIPISAELLFRQSAYRLRGYDLLPVVPHLGDDARALRGLGAITIDPGCDAASMRDDMTVNATPTPPAEPLSRQRRRAAERRARKLGRR